LFVCWLVCLFVCWFVCWFVCLFVGLFVFKKVLTGDAAADEAQKIVTFKFLSLCFLHHRAGSEANLGTSLSHLQMTHRRVLRMVQSLVIPWVHGREAEASTAQ
jgi:hypothetical protein